MNIYVIGPVTGKPSRNIKEFSRVKEALRIAGHKARIPHEFIGDYLRWDDYMRISVREMLRFGRFSTPSWPSYRYGGIAMLDGWEDSKGARIEHDLAVSLGIECRPWREWL